MNDKVKVPEELDRALLDAATNVLRAIGWDPLVIGGLQITQGHSEYNFRLSIGFTGKKPERLA